jgi:hypothetical protein
VRGLTWIKIAAIVLTFSLVSAGEADAQQDTAKKDTTDIYKDIEQYSRKSKFGRLIYKNIFRKPAKKKTSVKRQPDKSPEKFYLYEGKIIRNIRIDAVGPFGYTLNDTVHHDEDKFIKAGNNLHINTLDFAVRNLLLFRKGSVFDSLEVHESERLIRSQRSVHDVRFFYSFPEPGSDSVDIYIRMIDKWSITPYVEVTDIRSTVELSERNFLGTMHEFSNTYTYRYTTGKDAYKLRYSIPNIRHTFVTGAFQYGTDENGNTITQFELNRNFYSPLTKWAGGVKYNTQRIYNLLEDDDSLTLDNRFIFDTQDYWAGYSFQIRRGKREQDRSTRLILSMRYTNVGYKDKADDLQGLDYFFFDKEQILGQAGISYRSYVRQRYLFKYGVAEDVSVGTAFSIVGGTERTIDAKRKYFGARVATGDNFRYGFINSYFEYGTFFKGLETQQGVFNIGFAYFTNLIELGNWKFRQFVSSTLSTGIDRFDRDTLVLNDGVGLDGFNSVNFTGTKRFIATFQTQSYAPWEFLGFHFGPYLIASFGLLSDEQSDLFSSYLYTHLGFGVLINNNNLIINTFQVSLSFYPFIPGTGYNVFKVNSVRTTDFGLPNYELNKPEMILYK